MSCSRKLDGLKRNSQKHGRTQDSRNNNACTKQKKDNYSVKEKIENTKMPLKTKKMRPGKIFYKVKVPKSRLIESLHRSCSLKNDTERYNDTDSVESTEEEFDRNDNHYSRKRTNWNQHSKKGGIFSRNKSSLRNPFRRRSPSAPPSPHPTQHSSPRLRPIRNTSRPTGIINSPTPIPCRIPHRTSTISSPLHLADSIQDPAVSSTQHSPPRRPIRNTSRPTGIINSPTPIRTNTISSPLHPAVRRLPHLNLRRPPPD